MKTILIDDETNALVYMKNLCLVIPQIELVGMFENALEAMHFLENNPIDLIFLDIVMPGMSGINAAACIRLMQPNIGIIFVTSYDYYAYQAFQLEAVDYILKPAKASEILRAVEKAAKLLSLQAKKRVQIHTFGNFSVKIDGKSIYFSNAKSKELLAYLVDQKGDVTTMSQITSALWEERPYTESVKLLYRKAVMHLNQLCRAYDVTFFESKRANCLLDLEELDCDYFHFLAGDIKAIESYTGKYMIDYSWSEYTIPYLNKRKKQREWNTFGTDDSV